jgi:hypothetical protein
MIRSQNLGKEILKIEREKKLAMLAEYLGGITLLAKGQVHTESAGFGRVDNQKVYTIYNYNLLSCQWWVCSMVHTHPTSPGSKRRRSMCSRLTLPLRHRHPLCLANQVFEPGCLLLGIKFKHFCIHVHIRGYMFEINSVEFSGFLLIAAFMQCWFL